MPLGSLSISNNPIPLFASPYTTGLNTFTGISALAVAYRTSCENVRHLVPEMLELENEPLITAWIVTYDMSSVGSYNEYVHAVEVTYHGEKFNYCLSLILDNEAAIFSGREVFGFPKTFRKVVFERSTGTGIFLGQVEKPEGRPLVRFGFTPSTKLDSLMNVNKRRTLNLRIIPSPVHGMPPSVKELVLCHLEMTGGETWLGTGSISFPETMEYHPLHKLQVSRYEDSFYIHNASVVLHPPETTTQHFFPCQCDLIILTMCKQAYT